MLTGGIRSTGVDEAYTKGVFGFVMLADCGEGCMLKEFEVFEECRRREGEDDFEYEREPFLWELTCFL